MLVALLEQINKFMEAIGTKAGLGATKKRFTNHSLRKITVTKLWKFGATNKRENGNNRTQK